MKKLYNFVIICLYILFTIGCAGYLFYYGKYLFGVGSLFLTILSFPEFKKAFKELIG